jgi:hypothetical protein
MQRHRHQDFIRFLNVTEAAVPKGKAIHAIVDDYATHNDVGVKWNSSVGAAPARPSPSDAWPPG